jgi:hypothetical protein
MELLLELTIIQLCQLNMYVSKTPIQIYNVMHRDRECHSFLENIIFFLLNINIRVQYSTIYSLFFSFKLFDELTCSFWPYLFVSFDISFMYGLQ